MFESVDKQLENHDISWDYCLVIGLDNTNTNIGEHNSIKSRANEKNKSIIIAGCPCHILHNASNKASVIFSQITGFDIEDHSVDLYHWFDKSSKRKSVLKEYYEFYDTDYAEVIKFISTWWLCLEMCINRELLKFQGLRSYFLSETFSNERYKRLEKVFNDPILEVYLMFYQGVLPVFTIFNRYLQREEPLIYQLHDAQERFMNKLASRFIKPEIIQENKNQGKSFAKLDISWENQKDDNDLGIGMITKRTLRQLFENGDISKKALDKFFDGARAFFSKAYEYCVKWLPLEDPLLKVTFAIKLYFVLSYSFIFD